MPLVAAFAVLFLGGLLVIALLPVSLFFRYRSGTARRLARGWVAMLNMLALLSSVLLFVMGAALTTIWVPEALPYSLLGLSAGATLGLFGLLVTRWEAAPGALYYTPNRFLVLGVTLLVTARILYGFWRGWHVWQADASASWIAAFGPAQSLAAGAVVLGYYLVFWTGVWRRQRRHQRAFT